MPEISPGTADEAVLIAKAAQGDGEAFADLYDRYVARVYRYIYYMARSPTEAEDLTAETFLNAWQAMPRYEMRGPPFIYWLLRIAYNVTLNYLRRRRRHGPISQGLHLEDTGPTPERALEAYANGIRVRQALLHLGPLQRQVLVLRFIEELSYPEIAEIVGKTVGAVRVIQHRALSKLRTLLLVADE